MRCPFTSRISAAKTFNWTFRYIALKLSVTYSSGGRYCDHDLLPRFHLLLQKHELNAHQRVSNFAGYVSVCRYNRHGSLPRLLESIQYRSVSTLQEYVSNGVYLKKQWELPIT